MYLMQTLLYLKDKSYIPSCQEDFGAPQEDFWAPQL